MCTSNIPGQYQNTEKASQYCIPYMRKARKSRNAVMIAIAPYTGGKPEKENNNYYNIVDYSAIL